MLSILALSLIHILNNVAEHDLDDEENFDFTIENNSDYESLFYQVWDMINENVRFKNITINLYSHDCSDNFMVLDLSLIHIYIPPIS